MAHQAKAALQSFSLANDVLNISPQDEIYKYDAEENRKILRAEPWKSEYAVAKSSLVSVDIYSSHSPHYFKTCKISAVSLIKMVSDRV